MVIFDILAYLIATIILIVAGTGSWETEFFEMEDVASISDFFIHIFAHLGMLIVLVLLAFDMGNPWLIALLILCVVFLIATLFLKYSVMHWLLHAGFAVSFAIIANELFSQLSTIPSYDSGTLVTTIFLGVLCVLSVIPNLFGVSGGFLHWVGHRVVGGAYLLLGGLAVLGFIFALIGVIFREFILA